MFATIDLPGGCNFTYRHFALRPGQALDKAVAAWRKGWLDLVGESRETLDAVRRGFVISDRDAEKVRYQSGAKVFNCLDSRYEWR